MYHHVHSLPDSTDCRRHEENNYHGKLTRDPRQVDEHIKSKHTESQLHNRYFGYHDTVEEITLTVIERYTQCALMNKLIHR
jgi:hypothetical protein